MISRRPREITAPIDENIIVAERHVARGRWTTAELPFTIVRRRRVQRGVQHYDTTVADLQQTKEEEEENHNYENLWNVARWTFVDRVFEQSSRHDYIFHEIFSPPRRKYPFSLRRKKISTTRFRKPAPLHGQSGFLLVRAFAPTCPTPPLQFAREPDVSSTTQTYPQVFSRNKGLSREYLHRYVYLKSETKGNFI